MEQKNVENKTCKICGKVDIKSRFHGFKCLECKALYMKEYNKVNKKKINKNLDINQVFNCYYCNKEKTTYRAEGKKCHDCIKLDKRSHYYENKEKISLKKIEKRKNASAEEIEKRKVAAQKYYEENSERIKEKSRKYYHKNKDKIQLYQKLYNIINYDKRKEYDINYRIKNKEIISKKNKQKYLDKKNKNHFLLIKIYISSSIRRALKNNGFVKNRKSSFNFLPFSFQELKNHLESQFEPWMTWKNWGTYRISEWDDNDQKTWKWQLDHIIPHSYFKYISMSDPKFKECWSLSNLRPLSAKENVRKGNRF